MAGGEVGESFSDTGEEFDLPIGDGLGEADNAIVFFGGDGGVAELLEASNQGTPEAA